jgi:hypothetical protein
MGTDPTGLGGNARGDIGQFQSTFQPGSLFSAGNPLVPEADYAAALTPTSRWNRF